LQLLYANSRNQGNISRHQRQHARRQEGNYAGGKRSQRQRKIVHKLGYFTRINDYPARKPKQCHTGLDALKAVKLQASPTPTFSEEMFQVIVEEGLCLVFPRLEGQKAPSG